MNKLMEGLRKFQNEVFPTKRELFERLAKKQEPSTLFITCSDSRVVPEVFTQTEPGEMFVIKNAGNLVPPFGQPGEGIAASIEFAVAVLGVKHIVVCGHSECGAMNGLLHPERLTALPSVASWLQQAEATRRVVLDSFGQADEAVLVEALIRENALMQVQNLQTHPAVASGVARGQLLLYAWVYDIREGRVDAYDATTQRYVPLNGFTTPHISHGAHLRRGSGTATS
jgi:carbonic anhydrase